MVIGGKSAAAAAAAMGSASASQPAWPAIRRGALGSQTMTADFSTPNACVDAGADLGLGLSLPDCYLNWRLRSDGDLAGDTIILRCPITRVSGLLITIYYYYSLTQ